MIRYDYTYIPIPQKEKIQDISERFSLNKYIAAILIQKLGYNIELTEKFLKPDLKNLHDPFLIKDIDKALDIIEKYIKNNKKILIFGDYDVDGVTGVSVLYNFLVDNFNIKDNLEFKCANRFNEGYGLSNEVVEYAKENNLQLIITVDCGTKDYETIKLAKSYGLDVIVTDHHEFGNEANEADVIINNKNPSEYNLYPFRELSGCGIVFKLIQALARRFNIPEENTFKYLDLVALSTSCDLVPLIDENRILLHYGLNKINNNAQIGIKALLECLNKYTISNEDLLFKVGPTINAPGRISNAEICVKLFTTSDVNEAKILAEQIKQEHTDRKKICLDISNEILDKIDVNDNEKSTVLYKDGWHIGVLGIIAIRCIEKKNVPTIILTNKDDDYIIGSVRSISGLNILKVLDSCSNTLERYGGHELAAGLSLRRNNLDNFITSFKQNISSVLENFDCKKKLEINIKIPLCKIDKEFFLSLIQLSPFGIGNQGPLFMSTCKIIKYEYYYNDTFFFIKDKNNNTFNGFYKNKKINITGDVCIVYKVMFKKEILLNIIDIQII